MTAKYHRMSWVQIMALLALFAIVLGVIGTGVLTMMPVQSDTSVVIPTISGEITQ